MNRREALAIEMQSIMRGMSLRTVLDDMYDHGWYEGHRTRDRDDPPNVEHAEPTMIAERAPNQSSHRAALCNDPDCPLAIPHENTAGFHHRPLKVPANKKSTRRRHR